MRIVQVANFYSSTSGGLRTTLDALRAGYDERGHDVTLVVPGQADTDRDDRWGRRITIAGPRVSGGYRMIVRPDRLRSVLRDLRPDSIEMSDKLLVHAAAQVDARMVLISHERLDGILANRLPTGVPLTALADRWNRRITALASTVVCASAYAAEEFTRIGVATTRVPLGVDLASFRPLLRGRVGAPLIVCAGRLSPEKRPELVLDAVRLIRARGIPARVVFAGDGPMRRALERSVGRVPVEFRGHIASRPALAALLASASVAVAPCPVETFGLAALEALASGTPVVAADSGATPELITDRVGRTARPTPGGFADAIADVLAQPAAQTRTAARARAELFPWSATIDRMLAVHGAQRGRRAA